MWTDAFVPSTVAGPFYSPVSGEFRSLQTSPGSGTASMLLSFDHSWGCVMVPPCSFDSHFPNDRQRGASFDVRASTCRPSVWLYEMFGIRVTNDAL